MSSKEKFIVLDVEGMQTCRPYNIGYIIADRDGKIYKKHSFIFPVAFWENIQNCLSIGQAIEMTHTNIQEMLNDMNKPKRKRKYKSMTIQQFYKQFSREIKHYKVKRLFAYNVNFDKGALNRLFGDKLFKSLNLEYCDIISGILTTKLLTKKYVKFCFTNGYVTLKGYPSYKAEYVYRYLTNNLTFVEEHTGLSDVLIEYFILLTAFKCHKPLNFTPIQAWRKLKEFVELHNLSAV